MKIIGWIAFISFALIVLNVIVYLGLRLASPNELAGADIIVAVFGLIVVWVCFVIYRTLLSSRKTRGN